MTEDRTFPERPYVGVGAIVHQENKVLLIRRGKPPRAGQWSLPGGAQKLGERVEETAIREVREETGLEIEVTGLVDVVDFVDHAEDGTVRHHYTLVDIAGRVTGGTLSAGDDADDARWFAPKDLAGLGLWDETVRVISKATQMPNTQTLPAQRHTVLGHI